jgi:type I restriction enzyme S subunit
VKLRSHAAYRATDARWLAEIPAHWEFVPSNWLFRESIERARPDDLHLSATQKYGVIPLQEYERLEGRRVTHAFKNLDQRKHAELNDFVISMRSFEGGIERVMAQGCVRSSYIVLHTTLATHVGYFSYLFKSTAYIQGLQATSTFIRDGQDLNFNNFRQIKLPRLGVQEQRKIATFLDRETARIDALIERKTRFIELLREKRQALITHAVTKGLHAGVPMKDSGVEWLGTIPAGWSTARLRFVCDVTTGNKDTVNAMPDGAYPFYVRSQDVERIDTYSADCEAVLTAGDGAGVGKVYHYAIGKFDFHQRVYMMYNFREVRGKFFYHYLSSLFAAVALDGGAKSTVDSLRMPVFKNFQITIPGLGEQEAIIEFIENRTTRIDTLIAKTERSIELLREKRTALITAAVTGKIDLREVA